ncbi:spore maturation protein [Anaerobacillus sp. CMMVII]|uniref:nucleoside recognition domain-containing protein n=1 Tax=Anaerobacillus sp. CMMVII TaxID=2755588 RepID=UPI0021B7361A|nr:nucleoside recognition domain-containing protein [Anaerobacillus sp. CMMVII]MCT8138829.1 spore maturation protein [Anaerobacillus sp. CMMVII]
MVNIIWMAMLIIGVIFAAINGTMGSVNEAIFKGAQDAVTICIGLISILVFWLGLMRIAQASGLLEGLAKIMRPIATRLFPEVPSNHPAMGYILSNMTANLFGLGNAATPMGIKAMEQLKKLNGDKDSASRSMITLLAINTASITLIPTTVISIRMNYGSANPTEIVGTTLIATFCSTLAAIMIDRFFYYRRVRKGRDL